MRKFLVALMLTFGVTFGLGIGTANAASVSSHQTPHAIVATANAVTPYNSSEPPPCGPGNDGAIWYDPYTDSEYQCANLNGSWGWYIVGRTSNGVTDNSAPVREAELHTLA
ncbi:hypothetical protein [Catenulispora pinisilvae]|uniref:hypothetical protein n=1 Tax=Catenulispora pinisilvae TaxID=2705253 RepID=UPI00189238BC|nr:hypothetical protein [Catenulispora pinisilvae]